MAVEPTPHSGNGNTSPGFDPAMSNVSVVGALTVLLRNRAWFLVPFTVVAILVVALGYPRGLAYTSVTSFVTEAQRAASGVTALAAQLGVAGAQGSTTSPLFYPELIRSPQFMQSVVEAKFPDGASGTPRTLVDILGTRSQDPRMGAEMAARVLGDMINVAVSPQTGIVKLAVTAGNAKLAQAIADTTLSKVQDFNIRVRQGRASAERQFVERRLAEVRSDLRAAEDRLSSFLDANKGGLTGSPALQFTKTRLEREVILQQQVYTTLSTSYEQAKVDEVRDTPVISVMSQPDLPVLPNPRGRFRLALLAIFAGLGVGLVTVFIVDQLRGDQSSDMPQHAEFARLIDEMRGDARSGKLRDAALGRRPSKISAN